MATVAGVFDNPIRANEAINDLMSVGIDRNDITLLMSDKTREAFKSAGMTENERLARGTTAGSATGGVLGALIAGLTTIGGLAIPGVGLLLTGPLVAIATGAGAGAFAGGLAGLLISAGFNQSDADKYTAEIKAGKAVVVAHGVDKEDVSSVRSILNNVATSTKAA